VLLFTLSIDRLLLFLAFELYMSACFLCMCFFAIYCFLGCTECYYFYITFFNLPRPATATAAATATA